NSGTKFQRQETIAFASHNHAKAIRLQQGPELARQIKGVILFVAITADGALVETAVTGIEHDGSDAVEMFDHVRAQLRLERFGEIDARDHDFSVVDKHRKA